MDCMFCAEFAAGHTGPGERGNRIICESDGWVLLPTLGCFVPGYCLLMPIDHIDAIADTAPAEMDKLEASLEAARDLVASVFGPTIVAEHGPRGCNLGAGCCGHAHLHLIPVPDPTQVTAAYHDTGGPGERLDRLTDLPAAVSGPYLYLSSRPDEHLLWPSKGFARQYVRRVCARLHGLGDRFDWRDYPYRANQELTIELLRPAADWRMEVT